MQLLHVLIFIPLIKPLHVKDCVTLIRVTFSEAVFSDLLSRWSSHDFNDKQISHFIPAVLLE